MADRITSPRRPEGGGFRRVMGSGCGILFGLIFAAAGGFFLFIIGGAFIDNVLTYSWEEVPASLDKAEMQWGNEDRQPPFEVTLAYRYSYGGTDYTSSVYSLNNEVLSGSEFTPLERMRRGFVAADPLICWVNPEAPGEAVLAREGLEMGLFLLLPLIFIIAGLAVVVGSLRARKRASSAEGREKAITAGASGNKRGGRLFVFLFCSLFFLIGAGLSWPLLIGPLMQASRAKSWNETPCTVLWSTVRIHTGDDSTTYSVDIFYEYQVDGQTFRSNRYGFFGGSSSGRESKQEVVDAYPAGEERTCWVDPDDPLEAVIKPELGLGVLIGLLPLLFLIGGGIGMMAALRMKSGRERGSRLSDRRGGDEGSFGATGGGILARAQAARGDRGGSRGSSVEAVSRAASGGDLTAALSATDPDSPRVLAPSGGRLAKLGGCLIFGLFWNGIVSVFVWQAIEGFKRGNPEWFLVIFLIPFVLIGVATIIGFFYNLLAQFNPKPVLTLRPGCPRTGSEAELSWTIQGGAGRIAKLEILLEGKESATYRRGTSSVTDTETFYRKRLAQAIRVEDVREGRCRLELPADLPPSLDLGNNRIRWAIQVRGDVPFWPDVGDDYSLEVILPRSAGQNTP